jgi:hypothetical protein
MLPDVSAKAVYSKVATTDESKWINRQAARQTNSVEERIYKPVE